MQKKSGKQVITHWSPEEELNYHFFLVCKADQLLSNKSKAQGFYVQMSEFIQTRDKVQCRSHHEKMINRFKKESKGDKKRLEELNLQGFYQDHITLRLLDSAHLMKEIEHNLAIKVQKKLMKKEFYEIYREKAQRNISLFNNQISQTFQEQKHTPSETELVPQFYPRVPSYLSTGAFLQLDERPLSNLFYYFEDEF